MYMHMYTFREYWTIGDGLSLRTVWLPCPPNWFLRDFHTRTNRIPRKSVWSRVQLVLQEFVPFPKLTPAVLLTQILTLQPLKKNGDRRSEPEDIQLIFFTCGNIYKGPLYNELTKLYPMWLCTMLPR